MRADPLTKQLPFKEAELHMQQSLQLYPQGVVGHRCACYRCEGPNVFVKTRCDTILSGDVIMDMCEHCQPHGGRVSPRGNSGFRASTSCTCACRGAAIFLIAPAAGFDFTNTTVYGHPTSGTSFEDSLSPALPIDLPALIIDLLVVYIISISSILFIFYVWAWWKYVRRVSGDEKMQRSGRGSKSDDEPSKRGRTRGNTSNKSIEELCRDMQDLRTEDQRDIDERRRLGTQCAFIGWFPVRDGENPTNPGSKLCYRRCTRTITPGKEPWCWQHYMLENEDKTVDPGLPKDPSPDGDDDKDGNKDTKGKKGTRKTLGIPSYIFSGFGRGEVGARGKKA